MFTDSLILIKHDIKTMFTENLRSSLSKRNISMPITPKCMRICWLITAFR